MCARPPAASQQRSTSAVSKGATFLELLSSKDKPLLIRWDALLILDLGLHVVNGIRALYLEGNGLPSQGLHKNLHPTTKTQHQVEGGLLLNVVVGQGTAILQLLTSKDKPLLIWWDTLLILDLSLDVSSPPPSEGAAIFKLLPGKDKPLLVWRDTLFVLDLGLNIVNRIGALHLQGNGLAGEGLHEDLHPTAKTQHQVKGRLLLDVIVSKGAAILQLLAGEDQPLLVRWDPFLVLNLGLDVVNGVRAFHLEGDCLASECLHEDLHLKHHEKRIRVILINPKTYTWIYTEPLNQQNPK
ncbi:hypothetical protein AKJ16_DCAP03184 [Drosera capensis]